MKSIAKLSRRSVHVARERYAIPEKTASCVLIRRPVYRLDPDWDTFRRWIRWTGFHSRALNTVIVW